MDLLEPAPVDSNGKEREDGMHPILYYPLLQFFVFTIFSFVTLIQFPFGSIILSLILI